jgi:anthranilate phosphoribosyltransferase
LQDAAFQLPNMAIRPCHQKVVQPMFYQRSGSSLIAIWTLVERALAEANIAFLMAPRHHAAMRHVAPVRAALGVRTIFNLLGPLSNPALVKRIMVGVFEQSYCAPFAHVLARLGTKPCLGGSWRGRA